MGQLFNPPYMTSLDSNGSVGAGDKLYFYTTGTTTPATVYSDSALTTALTNPVVADSAGRFPPIYLGEGVVYRVTHKTAAGAEIKDIDPANTLFSASSLPSASSDNAAITAALLYSGTGAAAVARSLQSRLRDFASVQDYGATGDGTTDDTDAFSAAAAANPNRPVHCPLPESSYSVSSSVINSSTIFVFEGGTGSLSGTATATQLKAVFLDDVMQMASGLYAGGVPIADDLRSGRIEIVAGTIRPQQAAAITLTASGTTATATKSAHGYAVGDSIVVAGATETDYNGTFTLTAVTDDTFSYTMSGSPTSPATGSPTARKPAQWDYISNSLHTPVGVSGDFATASSSIITIDYAKTYSKVISFICGADETFANALNMTVGASVGVSTAELKASINLTLAAHVYHDGTDWQISYGAGQGGSGTHNVEITGVSIPINGTILVEHSNCPGIDVTVMPFTNNGAVTPYIPALRSANASEMRISFINPTTDALRADSAGNTRMAMHVRKNFSEGILLDGTSNSGDYDLTAGNIWFFGIMLV